MMREIRADKPPALMLMQYDPAWCVRRLVAVHPIFVTPSIIRKRATAHTRPRSGQLYWMCDFDLSVVPDVGKIVVVKEHKARSEKDVRAEFEALKPLKDVSKQSRGWTGLVLGAVRKIGNQEFTLAEVYAHEEAMHAVYPENSHVRDKIRQQLQVLRDLGYVEFLSKRGEYRMLR
jgi:type II restriction enzyme